MHNPLIPGMYDMGAGVLGFAGLVVWGFFSLLALAVGVGLVFLLVRFLLVATRAAQLYVAKNEPPKPPAAPRPSPTAPSAQTSAAPSSVSTPPVAAPSASTSPVPPASAPQASAPRAPSSRGIRMSQKTRCGW